MWPAVLSGLTGIIVGLIFAVLRLPVPAPRTFAGVMGILGIFLGFLLGEKLVR